MENFVLKKLNNETEILIPFDTEMPLSTILKEFNEYKPAQCCNVILDMLFYVGNKNSRFKKCHLENGEINIQKCTTYKPDAYFSDKIIEFLAELPISVIGNISVPSIRRSVLHKKPTN